MDMDSLGAGAGGGLLGGFVGILATAFGFKQRQDRTDADIAELKKAVVFKDSHAECSASWHRALDSLEKKIDDGNSKLLTAILERTK